MLKSQVGGQCALPDEAGGVAGHNRPGIDILHDCGAGAHDCPLPHDNAWTHKSVGADPSLVFDPDGRVEKGDSGVAVIVSAGTQVGAVGDGYFLTDCNRAKIVNERVLTYGRPVTDTEVPRKIHPRGPRSEEHTSELQSPMYLVCRL